MPVLKRWLDGLGLGQYRDVLADRDVDLGVLATLTEEDLRSFGLSLGHRRKLLGALRSAATGPARAAAERRQLTVLLCDLVGSSDLATRLDPEDMAAVMQEFQSACATVIKGWGGHVAQVRGDGILAYFGFPAAHEDDAERGVRAGLELVREVAKLMPRPNAPLAARVGIATGLVVIPDQSAGGPAQGSVAVGETPHLAARLQGLAAAGAVVIAEGTRRLVGDLFDLVDLGRHRIQGGAPPYVIWQVLGERRIESRFEALRGAGPTPLVGRERELEHLLQQFDSAIEGRGRVVLLVGEAGIGKSSILRALREQLSDRPHVRLNHYCSPSKRDTPLFPVIRLLERAADLRPGQSAEQQFDRLKAALAPGTPDVTRTAALLADLLGISIRSVLSWKTPRERLRMTLDALIDQGALYAQERPVLAVYEDVHWIDPSSRELVERVVRAAATLRILMLVTARPEFAPPWDLLPHVTTLHLGRLDRAQSTALIDRMAAPKALPPAVAAHILEHGDGIPLFIEELTKGVLESGSLEDHGTHYDLVAPLCSAIPLTVRDSLMARLDRLGADKEVAQVSAVVGRDFPLRMLATVLGREQQALEAVMNRLVRAGIMVRHGLRGDARYGFRHALIRDAAYDSLLTSRRREIHARVVEVLRAHFADLVAQRPEVLARHAALAGFARRAAIHWLRAGQRALACSATTEAVGHLRHAQEQLQTQPRDRRRMTTELAIQVALGSASVASEGHAALSTGQAYQRARELCRQLGPTPRLFPVLWGQWAHRTLRAELDQALAVGREFHQLAVRDGSPGAIQVAERTLGATQFWLGHPRIARTRVERALQLYDPVAHGRLALDYAADLRVVGRCHLSLSLFVLGEPERAARESQGAIDLSAQLDQVYGRAHAFEFACLLAVLRRDPALAGTMADALCDLAGEHDYPFFAAIAQMAGGWALARRGRPGHGIAPLVRGLGAYRATGARLHLCLFLSLLAEAQQSAGDTTAALHHAHAALEQATQTGERWYLAEIHRLIANLTLAAFDHDHRHAERHLRQAIDIARAQGARTWELRAAVDLARLQRRRGRSAAPVDLLAPLMSWFEDRGELAEIDQARALLHANALQPGPDVF